MTKLNRTVKVAGAPTIDRRMGSGGKSKAVGTAFASTRKRAVVVGSLAAAMVVSMSPMADAHGGSADKVHACVVPSSGTVRIVGANESCKTGETPLDWSHTSGTVIGPGTITGSNLALGTVTGQANNEDGGVPSGNLGLLTVGRGNLVLGAVDTSQLADNAVTAGKVADNAVTAESIRPGTISSPQLAGSDTDTDLNMPGDQTVFGAVTSEKIADGTIANRDLDPTLAQLLQALQEKVANLEAKVAALEAK